MGRWRGGLGQEVVIESLAKAPMRAAIQSERIRSPADGLLGGAPGVLGEVLLNGKKVPDAKGMVILERGDRLVLRMPGGGGYGNPAERDPAAAAHDREMGYVA
jgi:N-methylhydantoinase B